MSSGPPGVRLRISSRCTCVLAVWLAVAAGVAHAQAPSSTGDRENDAFVVSYRCDRGAVAVAYPAYRDAATQPVRVAWQGRNYVMYAARSGSGARYVTRNGQLEWWTKGNDAFLAVPGVADKVLDRCEAF